VRVLIGALASADNGANALEAQAGVLATASRKLLPSLRSARTAATTADNTFTGPGGSKRDRLSMATNKSKSPEASGAVGQ
jgi:hypothetical protein